MLSWHAIWCGNWIPRQREWANDPFVANIEVERFSTFCFDHSFFKEGVAVNFSSVGSNQWVPGQWAIYRKSKRSATPGPRAASVQATPKGEQYSYVVDKFWVVRRVLDSGTLELQTPSGKRREISSDDPNLRKPSWIERLIWRERFVRAEEPRTTEALSSKTPDRSSRQFG